MAGKLIKGITVEIGGDTTKLGKALDSVEKKTRDLSGELGQINKLLKMDPGNVELLAQKQKVLADAVSNTKAKLETLKTAEKQVQEQFERGEVSEEQVRALQREIIATTKKLDGYEKAAKETAEAVENMGKESADTEDELQDTAKGADKAADEVEELADASKEAGDGLSSAAVAAGTFLGNLAADAIKGVVEWLGNAVEESREYRTEMGKLDTAFTTNGHSAQDATRTYKELQGVLGETDQAVEAANHLAKLCDNEKELSDWTNIATGVYATFGASIPIEGLTEAANETAKVGTLTGSLADALNWAGVSEEDFQAKLDACSTEQERQALITETLNGLYSEAADKYRETNAEVIRANQANEEWASIMGEVGGAVDPILTDVKLLGASLVGDLVPGITGVAEAFREVMNGNGSGAALENLGEALSGIFEQIFSTITNMLPGVTLTAVSLVSTLASSVMGMLPQLVSVGAEVIESIIRGITVTVPRLINMFAASLPELLSTITKSIYTIADVILYTALPAILDALPAIFSGLAEALVSMTPNLVELIGELIVDVFYNVLPSLLNAITSIMAVLTEQLPVIVPMLTDLIVSLVGLLVEIIPDLIPQLVNAITTMIEMLATALPALIPPLVEALVAIVTLLVEQLPVIIPLLIDACIQIVSALIAALPDILTALTDALPVLLQAVWDAIVMIFENLPLWFEQIFQGAVDLIQAAWSVVAGWFGEIWAKICDIFAPVGDFFSRMFSQAWSSVKSAWSGAKSWFSGIWSSIKNTFSSVSSWFRNIFSQAWTGIKNVFSGVKSFFLGIWDKIKSAFTSIGTKIGDAISGAVRKGINGLLSSAERIINGFLRMINGAIGLINKIPGVSISQVKMVSFTRLAKGGVVDEPTPAIFGEDGAEAVVPLEKNTEWIQKVAREFTAQVRAEAGADLLGSSASAAGISAVFADNGLLNKLDSILAAIERGQVIAIDSKQLIGATAAGYDSTLGQRHALVARGAL